LCRSLPPLLNILSPGSARQGDLLSVALHGKGLKAGMTIDLGPGLQVLHSELASAEELRAQVQVLPAALVGERYVRAQCTDTFGAGRAHGFEVQFDCRRADTTGDGRVDGLDLAMIAARFGGAIEAGHPLDLNGDGDIDGEDLALLAAHFGRLAATCR
jgi:hypothetical protein